MKNNRESLKQIFQESAKSLDFEVETAKLLFTEEMLTLMASKGFSRTKLADSLGVRPARITALLQGNNNFTLETMIRICRALGVKYTHHIQKPGCKTHWVDVPTFANPKVSENRQHAAKIFHFHNPLDEGYNPVAIPSYDDCTDELAIAS
jgi:transcriptional regulator with XRE-family HTH domain